MTSSPARARTAAAARAAVVALVAPVALVALAAGVAFPAAAQPLSPSPTRDVGFDQKMGVKLPLDATFRDESGRPVRLGDYFGKRPVLLQLAYYECPMLCGLAMQGLARSLKGFSLVPGRDFDVVTISFDPKETPALARAKKTTMVDFYGRPGGEEGWHFLTGAEPEIERVTGAVGFRYRWDEAQKQYAHPTGLVVVTPDGVVSRYFFGVDYASKELKLGLSEASDGKVGGVTAQLLLLCYQYNPATGKYTAATLRVLKVAGAATVLALATFVLVMLRRERVRARKQVGVSA